MRITAGWCLGVALHACFILQVTGQQLPALKYRDNTVWVTGLNAETLRSGFELLTGKQWKEILSVYTIESYSKNLNQSVDGTYAWHGDSLSFTPTFSFAPGESYKCVFGFKAFLTHIGSKQSLSGAESKLELSFSIYEEKFPLTQVETIHPQADMLPENMLRMYVFFSAPMSPGEAYDHITLLKEDGTPIEKAFLKIDQELWDSERKRFTLLFDPGRVKRGIRSNLELGAPLKAGQRYSLIIDSAWRDEHGNSLIHSYKKSFFTTPAQRTKLSIENWNILTPAPATHQDLLIEFDRPIDYALALKNILVATPAGYVKGKVTLKESKIWQFTPNQPWVAGEYFIETRSNLEDVAGNNLNNVFDVDLAEGGRATSSEVVRHSFSIRPLVK